MSSTDLGAALLTAARRSLAHALDRPGPDPIAHTRLAERGATFVTLTQRCELRGCIGTLDAHRSLREDVEQNALAAAFRDPRFTPLAADELPITRIEVSVLSEQVALAFAGERELYTRLRPGVDGVVLSWRGRRATFLPQVWGTLPEADAFIAALMDKAGVPGPAWDDEIRIARYTVDKFVEAAAPEIAAVRA